MYWDYYDYTGDEKFLVERAYPFMKQTMLFFEDYLVKKGDVYTCYPSTSPENCANGNFEGAGKINACIDATMDISLIKCVAEKLIFVSEKLNIDIEEREKWKDILAHLPQYKVQHNTVLPVITHHNLCFQDLSACDQPLPSVP